MRLGIHGDGIEYATVAMNMADDVGTFWKPYLDDAIHPVFHEHPPLGFWIQSIFFRIFGGRHRKCEKSHRSLGNKSHIN